MRRLIPETFVDSPSLTWSRGEGSAFEMKFLVDAATASATQDWAEKHLALDPHGDPSLGGAYRSSTLYLDSPGLDLLRRRPGTGSRKYRLRRYGTGELLFLECKSRKKERVRKRRTLVESWDPIFPTETPIASSETWSWFAAAVAKRGLRPVCQVSYERTAFIGSSPEGPLRLTLDRRLRGTLNDTWKILPGEGRLPFLAEKVVLELKFRTALPLLFKEFLHASRLVAAPVSKYRYCLSAWGIPEIAGGAVDA